MIKLSKNRPNSIGFTVIELIVVIVIIGILAAITIVSYFGVTNRLIATSLKSDLVNAAEQLKLFQNFDTNSYFPATIDCTLADNSTNKCIKPSSGNAYTYVPNNSTNPRTYTIDVTNTNNTTYRLAIGGSPFEVLPITAISTSITTLAGTSMFVTLTPVIATATYQWQSADTSNGTYSNIAGATSSLYIPQLTDVGKYLKVVVTATGSYRGTLTSAASTVVTLTSITNINLSNSGYANVSIPITVSLYPPNATATYQWQSSDVSNGTYSNIVGATSSAYTPQLVDLGRYLKVIATATSYFTGTLTSSASTAVSLIPIMMATTTGSPLVGSTLTAGALSPSNATVTYQWQTATTSNGTYSNIAGATNRTYILQATDLGKYFKVIATATGNYMGTQTSAAVGAVTDPNWITIGTQTWAKFNLNVGNMITGATEQTNNGTAEKWCYSNSASNCTTYGGLYTSDEAMQYVTTEGAQGLCPTGAHIPTDNEWKILEMQLGMTQASADLTGYRGTGISTQLVPGGSSGLNLQPGGQRHSDGLFYNMPSYFQTWTSSISETTKIWMRSIAVGTVYVYRNNYSRNTYAGYPIRCIKN